MEIERKIRRFSLVTVDITNECPHRCVFCFNRWGSKQMMEQKTFHKVLQLLPYTADGGFSLASLYEPSVHPQFFQMMAAVPRQFKAKVSVGTNLDGAFSTQQLSLLANSHLHHVNVALPSFQEEQYQRITKADGKQFFENITRLRQFFDERKNRPRLKLNTMLLKENKDDLLALVQRAHEELHPYVHEIRTPMVIAENESTLLQGPYNEAAVRAQLLPQEELKKIKTEIDALGYRNVHVITDVSEESEQARIPGTPQLVYDEYSIYIGSNGEGFFLSDKNPFDMQDIENPFVFFSQALTARQTQQAALAELAVAPPTNEQENDPDFHCRLEKLIIWDEQFVEITGWALHRQLAAGEISLVLKAGEHTQVYRPKIQDRPDISVGFEDDTKRLCGFTCLLDPGVLPHSFGQLYELYVGIARHEELYIKHLQDFSF